MTQRVLSVLIGITVAFWLTSCASIPRADTNHALPESSYAVRPWAERPPVDITRRLSALRSALGSMQQAVHSYNTALQAQADQRNRQVFRQAELSRIEEEDRRLRALQTQSRNMELQPALSISAKPPKIVAEWGKLDKWQLGELMYSQVHGWGDWIRDVRRTTDKRANP